MILYQAEEGIRVPATVGVAVRPEITHIVGGNEMRGRPLDE